MYVGYQNISRFLASYHNTHYHLQDFCHGTTCMTKEEHFNFLHSSLRNVIEWYFGILKTRFSILKKMVSYPFKIKTMIIITCMALHNFIHEQAISNDLFASYEDNNNVWIDNDNDADDMMDEDQEPCNMDMIQDMISQQIYI